MNLFDDSHRTSSGTAAASTSAAGMAASEDRTELSPMIMFDWIKQEIEQINEGPAKRFKAQALDRMSPLFVQIMTWAYESRMMDAGQLYLKCVDKIMMTFVDGSYKQERHFQKEQDIKDFGLVSCYLETLMQKVVDWKEQRQQVKQEGKTLTTSVTPKPTQALGAVIDIDEEEEENPENHSTIAPRQVQQAEQSVEEEEEEEEECERSPLVRLLRPKPKKPSSSRTRNAPGNGSNVKQSSSSPYQNLASQATQQQKKKATEGITPPPAPKQPARAGQKVVADKPNKNQPNVSQSQVVVKQEVIEPDEGRAAMPTQAIEREQPQCHPSPTQEENEAEREDQAEQQNEQEDEDIYLRPTLREENINDDDIFSKNYPTIKSNNGEKPQLKEVKNEVQEEEEEQGEEENQSSTNEGENESNDEEGGDEEEQQEASNGEEDDEEEVGDEQMEEANEEENGEEEEEGDAQVENDQQQESSSPSSGTPPLPEDVQLELQQNGPTLSTLDRGIGEHQENLQKLLSTSFNPNNASSSSSAKKQRIVQDPIERVHANVHVELDLNLTGLGNRKRKLNEEGSPERDASLSQSLRMTIKRSPGEEAISEFSQQPPKHLPWHKKAQLQMSPSTSKAPAAPAIIQYSSKIKKMRRIDYEDEQRIKLAALKKARTVHFALERNKTYVFPFEGEEFKRYAYGSSEVHRPVTTTFLKGHLGEKTPISARQRHHSALVKSDVKRLVDEVHKRIREVGDQNARAEEGVEIAPDQRLLFLSRLFIIDSFLGKMDTSVFRNTLFLQLDHQKNMDMLIEGLKQQRQFALNNPKAFDLSYIFVMYGFDIIEKGDPPNVYAADDLRDWIEDTFRGVKISKERSKDKDEPTYGFTIPIFVLITIPVLKRWSSEMKTNIRDYNAQLNDFVNSRKNEFKCIDWAGKVEKLDPRTDEDLMSVLVRELFGYGVLFK